MTTETEYRFPDNMIDFHVVYDKHRDFMLDGNILTWSPDTIGSRPLSSIPKEGDHMLLLKYDMLGKERDIHGLYDYVGYDPTTRIHQWTDVPLDTVGLVKIKYHIHQRTDNDNVTTWSYTEEVVVPTKLPPEILPIILGLSLFIGVVFFISVFFRKTKQNETIIGCKDPVSGSRVSVKIPTGQKSDRLN
jgi:hypothetical protein